MCPVSFSVLLLLAALTPARAETSVIKIGKQYGLPYIQFVLMEDGKLIEKHAKLQGLGDMKVEWATLGGPAQINDGIISGAIDIGAVGLPNLITMWEKTRTNVKVRAIAGLNFMPLILVTRDPKLKSLKDFGEKDRIAVPSVKISMQAILLEMAVAKEFGDANYEKLDPLTVSMGHPDAFAALNSGTEVNSHFSSAPFQNRQLKMPGYHQVVSSYDIIGPHSVSCISMTTKFHDDNPKTVAAHPGRHEGSDRMDQGGQEGRRRSISPHHQGQDAGGRDDRDPERSHHGHHHRAEGRRQDQRFPRQGRTHQGEAGPVAGLLFRRCREADGLTRFVMPRESGAPNNHRQS